MTATWRTREELLVQLLTLQAQGLAQRALARALGISRNTVKKLLAANAKGREAEHSALPARKVRAPRASKLDAFQSRIAELLARYPEITAQRVLETLREEKGYDGGYTAIKKLVRRLRPAPRPEPSHVTPVYGPGKMSECDWSLYEPTYTDGRREKVQAFSYVLVHSRRKFHRLYRNADFHALIDGHNLAFERFAGCAHACKYDSQKNVVLRWEGQQPIYNPRFLAYCTYYQFRPEAVRGEPNAKPRVERGFWELERSFLNGRSFADFEDMQAQLARWLDTVVDLRLHHKRTALDRFAEEREHLLPLPRHPYDTARVAYRVCSIDGFVAWDGNQYAVPYDHVTDILPIRITQSELFVYAADLSCIARHELAPRGQGLRLDPQGLHPPPQRKSPIDHDQLRIAFGQMGERASDFFRLLSSGPPRLWGYQARQILLLRERFTTADLDFALGHAAAFGALEHRAVERIVAARSQPRSLDEYVAEPTVRRVTDALGHPRTAPRDLTDYDRLPGTSSPLLSPVSHAPFQETTQCQNEAARIQPSPVTPPPIPSPSDSADTSSSSD
jgi:transposase